MPEPGALLELWRHEGPRTLRAFRFFRDEDLAFQPQPGARSVADLLAHIIGSYWLARHWLRSETPPAGADPPPPGGIASAAALLQSAQTALFEVLSGLSGEDFLAEIAPFGVRETRGVMALGMMKHEIHHRGELYALARVCGRAPCNLYSPVPEESG